MKRSLALLFTLILAACGGGIHLPPVVTPGPVDPGPIQPPAAAFTERTTAVHVLPNCAVKLSLPAQNAYTGTTSATGYLAWLVRIDEPDPGGRLNAMITIECPGYWPLTDSFVIAPLGNQDIFFGVEGNGNQSLHRAGPQPVPPPITIRTGLVRADGRVFVDDQGAFNPLGVSFFWAIWGEKFDEDKYEANLKKFDNKAHYIRIFAEVAGGDINGVGEKVGWADREINPSWPDYRQQFADAIDRAYDKHGLRSEITIVAGGTNLQREATNAMLDVIEMRQHKIFAVEIANEENLPDKDLRDELTRQVMARYPQLQVSAYSTADPAIYKDLLSRGVGNSITPHTDRTNNTEDGAWRQVRQIYDFKFLPGTCRDDEPPGPQSSVATMEDPLHLAMTRAMSIIMGCGAYTFHPGAGIRGGGKADLARGRPANFYDDPNFDAQLNALVAVGTVIPSDAANWRQEGSHNPPWNNPMQADQFLDAASDHGVISLYAAHADSRFVVLPLGIREFVKLTSRDAAVIDVFNPITGEKVNTFTVDAGGTITLNGPERGGLGGYIVVGRLR